MRKSNGKGFRTGGSISWEEREVIVKEYLTGQFTKTEIWKKYTGHPEEGGQLLRWLRALGYEPETRQVKRRPKIVFLAQGAPPTVKENKNDQNSQQLQQRIKELEKQLEMAQLKAEGYELMIEIAEKELKIPIRKKSDTK